MAKDKNNGTWKYYLTVGCTFLLAGAGIVYNHGSQAKAYEQTAKDVIRVETDTETSIATLKKDGCYPSGTANDRILVIETKFDALIQGQGELKLGQDEILKRLEK